jgi:anti-anti-sigma factor
MEMHRSHSADGSAELLLVVGRLDAVTSSEFESSLVGSLRLPGTPLVIDLAGVDYLSSAGLRALIVAAKTGRASGRGFALAGLRENVMGVIRISGFDSFFPIYSSAEEALRSIESWRSP